MQLENVYSSMLPVNKAVIAGPAGPLSTWPFLAEYALHGPFCWFPLALLCAYHLLMQLSITRVARVKTLKKL